MARTLTRDQLESVLRYLGSKMNTDGVNTNDAREVLNWMIHNPMPSIEVMEADAAQQVIDEKAARIAHLRKSLAKLEAE